MIAGEWERYLQVPDAQEAYRNCHCRCQASFASQRESIRRIIEAVLPQSVCCLGAGVLNDIPYELLIDDEIDLYLVDWLRDSIDNGISLSIIQRLDATNNSCLYCRPQISCPEQFCLHFELASQTAEARSPVCDRFDPSEDALPRCLAFEKGPRPKVYYEDVTGGYATEFGRRITNELRSVKSWKQALGKAEGLAKRLRSKLYHRLDIPDHSVDLVTSSMVISQFEHEPYDFFSTQAAKRLGIPNLEEERKLLPITDRLHKTLFRNQMERHCEEIKRILTPGGRCYMSFEMFHVLPNSNNWFMVHGMESALEVLGAKFLFDFDMLPQQKTLTRFQADGSPSLVFSAVLTAK